MANGYLLDTNIWSALIRRKSAPLVKHISKFKPEQIFLSPIVFGELKVGYYKDDKTPIRQRVLDEIVAMAQPLTLDAAVSDAYARLRSTLEAAGTSIDPNDTWIAAEALHHRLVMVTDNVGEFSRVPKLRVENWLA